MSPVTCLQQGLVPVWPPTWHRLSLAAIKALTADLGAVALRLVQLKTWFPQVDVLQMVTRRQVKSIT